MTNSTDQHPHLKNFIETPTSNCPPEISDEGKVRNVLREHTVRRSVRLFGVDMISVYKDPFTETWNAYFDLILVQVNFDLRQQFPWSANVFGLYSIKSTPIDEVRHIEKWLENILLRIRKQIPAGPPHMVTEPRRREAWSPLPSQPLELECFAVKANDGEHHIIQKAPFPRGEYQWFTQFSKARAVWTWDTILSKFSHYYELPPV